MTHSESDPYSMWCFGLSEQDIACIRQCAGEECLVAARSEDALRDEAALLREEPTLFWVQADVWERLDIARVGGAAGAVPKVMVLDAVRSGDDLDRFIAADAEHVLRAPLTGDGVYRILRRTLEVCTIHADMGRMTREILLNRELLGRKADVLSFLFAAEERLNAANGAPALLLAAREVLSGMLPVRSLHAALWQRGADGNAVDVYLDGPKPDSRNGAVWRHMLIDAAHRLVGGENVVRLQERLRPGPDLPPQAGHILLLPLSVGKTPVGALMLLQEHDTICSRDQRLAINAVLARLACLVRLACLPPLPPARASRVRAIQTAH